MISPIGSGLPKIDTAGIGAALGASPASSASAAAGGGGDFASVMSQIAGDAVKTMKSAEQVSIQGLGGHASTQAVVEAVMSAERTLQTAITVRDKVVSAYLEISRMAI